MMRNYHLGRLDDNGRQALLTQGGGDGPSPDRAKFLQPRYWVKARLNKIRSISEDTKVFTFNFDHENQVSGLSVGQHLMMRAKDLAKQKDVLRAYTPISDTTDRSFLDVLVKLYRPDGDVPGGQMSMVLDKLSVGDEVDFKGPIGKFQYLGAGRAMVKDEERKVKSFVMICGGSGITPVYQVFRAVMQDPADETSCTVLDSNRGEGDILLRRELEALERGRGARCRILHTLTKGSEGWTGLRGRISEHLLQEYATPAEGSMVLICGPPGMESYVKAALAKMGWRDENVLTF